MKKLIFFTLFLSSQLVLADTYKSVDTIYRLGTVLTRDNADFIIINGFTSAGTCPLSSGLVVARFPSGESGARAYSLALAAKMAGKNVELAVDDTIKNSNGQCLVKSLEIKN